MNAVGKGLAWVGIEPGVFEVEQLLAKARAAVGLEDFGGDEFLEPLGVLCCDIREMGRELSTVARLGLVRDLQRSLVNRLRMQELLGRHPEIREQELAAPIFIIGSPRTGTTLLHNLLSRLPGATAPLLWELLEPVPPAERRSFGASGVTDRRIVSAQKLQVEIARMLPTLFAAHPIAWDWPEECLWLLANSFLSEGYFVRFPLPNYRQMYLRADWSWAIDEYADALRVLQWQRESGHAPRPEAAPRWVLKAPGHAFRLPELVAAFPDARFIRTHRDPRETIASICSLYERVRVATCPSNPRAIGSEVLEIWADSAPARLVEAHDAEWLPDERCFDIAFRTLVDDPFTTIERAYKKFGFELTDQSPMRQWLRENPRHSRGRHTYSLERYAIPRSEVLERTTTYRTHFAEFL
ncbi:hypothetical protein ENSA5_05380 [Enhygromyxa salina]|uniref:Sulfotransferase domain protein n=1 Tax=Enhygromyxa salina TaxID=215803 RepID=A0A2S9YI31_9BACT|nr:sulfotransferase [Enhygromyxa salina]PRQ04773.1 hypothetical protein ENSA5_05380 [Enhygromyxa salina]